jgi:hypothetical protein
MYILKGYRQTDKHYRWRLGKKSNSIFGLSIEVEIALQKLSSKEAENKISMYFEESNINWLERQKNSWKINLDKLKDELNFVFDVLEINELEILSGHCYIKPEISYNTLKSLKRQSTIINFIITEEDIMESKSKKIFLSHKSSDKPIVREYKKTLETFGFSPWFDEDNLIAGKELERGLLEGFKDSCAAIFFISNNFEDENYLATEINYAISQKREKKDNFSIISIVLPDSSTEYKIPELLKTYVWKEPKNDLQAIQDILKALPIKAESIVYR